jgi:hypothetical protein
VHKFKNDSSIENFLTEAFKVSALPNFKKVKIKQVSVEISQSSPDLLLFFVEQQQRRRRRQSRQTKRRQRPSEDFQRRICRAAAFPCGRGGERGSGIGPTSVAETGETILRTTSAKIGLRIERLGAGSCDH